MTYSRLFSAIQLHREKLLLAAILLLTLVLRLNFIHEPLDRDEGTYALIGKEILRGAIPYRDAIEIKPPGSLYLFAFFMLFGDSVEYIRIVTACYSLLTVTVVFMIAKMLGGVRAGLLAALLCGVFASGPIVQGSGSNTEVFMLLPVLAGMYYLFRGIDSSRRVQYMVSGLFFALAILIKTVSVPVYLLALLSLLYVRRPIRNWRVILGDLGVFIAPAVLLALLVCGYFAWHGAWSDFFFWNVIYNISYASTPPTVFINMLTSRGFATASEFLLLWVIALPTAYWLLSQRRTSKTIFLVLLLVATFVGVCMPGKFWPHYFIPMIPPLAIISGIGLAELLELRRGFLRYPAFLLIAIAFCPTVLKDYPYYTASSEEVSRLKFGSDVFVVAARVARYVKERTSPSDTIFQWGWEPEIYAQAGRRPANRFINHLILEQGPDPVAALREMQTSIITKQPKYVIFQPGRENSYGYTELTEIFRYRYHFEASIGNMRIYRLNCS